MSTLHQPFTPPMANDRIRTTISVAPEVHAIFVQMAEAAGTSVSRCMGDWLADTAEGAQFVAGKMLEARRAPKTVMREFQAMARGLVEAVDEEVESIRKRSMSDGGAERAEARGTGRAAGGKAPGAGGPPSSPTGVKSPAKSKSQGRNAA